MKHNSSLHTAPHVSMSAVALALALLAPARAATAQDESAPRPRTVGLVAGVAVPDLVGNEAAALVGVRIDAALGRILLVEGALSSFQGGPDRWYAPEVQLQVQLPTRLAQPYLGIGLGMLLRSFSEHEGATLSGAAGLRAAVSDDGRLTARLESRVRLRAGFGGAFGGAEFVAGLGYAF